MACPRVEAPVPLHVDVELPKNETRYMMRFHAPPVLPFGCLHGERLLHFWYAAEAY